MIILGIHDGHNSGACIISNGTLIAAVCEERLTREKNFIGYPKKSIDEVIKISKIKKKNISLVVYGSNFMHTEEHLKNKTEWYKAGYLEQNIENKKTIKYQRNIFNLRKKERVNQVKKHLGINQKRISFIEHHLAHAAAAYYGSPYYEYKKKVLIITADGAGDGLSSTVSIGYKNNIKRIAETKRSASLGKIYSRVAHFLGLKPWEDEYKIMGLAPYGRKENIREIIKIFEKIADVKKNNLFFSNSKKLDASFLYDYFKENLSFKRFDNISLAIQTYLENQLIKLVKNSIKKTKIKDIVVGGGVFMNVKANQKISELKLVNSFFAFPTCGDESLSIGAAWQKYYESHKRKCVQPFKNIYLGRDYSNKSYIKKILNIHLNKKKFSYEYIKNINQKVAKLLSEDEIIARFATKSEWGARALGNRSILANPKHLSNIEKINFLVKKRDFWMPFAPSILKEECHKFFKINKMNDYSFMALSAKSKKISEKLLSAAIHPRDKTGRLNIVDKNKNEEYWNLINEFFKITKIPCLLNTSFNLHGYPLVYQPEDAIEVLKKSGLKYLAVDHFLVKKND